MLYVKNVPGWLLRMVQRECRRVGRVTLRYDPYDEAALEPWLSTSRALARLTPAHQIELTL